MYLLDPENWQRSGRGRSVEFFATNEDLLWLLSTGLGDYGKYRIVGFDLVRNNGKYRKRPFDAPLADLQEVILSSGQRCQFWTYSPELCPGFDPHTVQDVVRVCSLSGFLLVEHGSRDEQRRLRPSAVGLVNEIRRVSDGKKIRQDDYEAEFRELQKVVRSSAVARTAPISGDAVEVTLPAVWLPGAARAWHVGSEQFVGVPLP